MERQQEFLGRFASLPFGDEAAIIYGQIRESQDLREKVMTAINCGELLITNYQKLAKSEFLLLLV